MVTMNGDIPFMQPFPKSDMLRLLKLFLKGYVASEGALPKSIMLSLKGVFIKHYASIYEIFP